MISQLGLTTTGQSKGKGKDHPERDFMTRSLHSTKSLWNKFNLKERFYAILLFWMIKEFGVNIRKKIYQESKQLAKTLERKRMKSTIWNDKIMLDQDLFIFS